MCGGRLRSRVLEGSQCPPPLVLTIFGSVLWLRLWFQLLQRRLGFSWGVKLCGFLGFCSARTACAQSFGMLFALSAMECGRRSAVARVTRVQDQPLAAVLQRASARAVTDFWGRLASFVALRKAPDSWADVPVDHPFVGRTAAGRLRLNRFG